MKPNKRLIPVAAVVVIAAVVTFVLVTRSEEARGELFFSGTVEATEARLGFEVPGRVAWVAVQEGDPVKAGRGLAGLDTTQAGAQLAQFKAQAEASEAILTELLAGSREEEVASAKAAAQAAKDRLDLARKDLERTKTLFEGGAVSPETHDQAATALQVAESQAAQAEEQLRLVTKGPRVERIAAQRADVARAQAAVATQEATLSLMTARSPFDALVTVRHREPGESVSPGAPVLTVANMSDRWVRIYVPETTVGRVHLGQKASLAVDSFPGKTYTGEVTFIASEAEFTPKNVQTAEERVKLVYMVKVRITDDSGMELKPGMPADVTLEASGS